MTLPKEPRCSCGIQGAPKHASAFTPMWEPQALASPSYLLVGYVQGRHFLRVLPGELFQSKAFFWD